MEYPISLDQLRGRAASKARKAGTPDSSWLKADVQAWLDDQGIEYEASATKADLLALVPEG